MWQAADIFARFLFSPDPEGSGKTYGENLLGNKSVVELGSGPGLGGLIAARWAKQVVLTDYQELVMELIETNIKKCNPNEKCEMLSAKVDWTKVKDEEYFGKIELVDAEKTVKGKL